MHLEPALKTTTKDDEDDDDKNDEYKNATISNRRISPPQMQKGFQCS